MKTTAKMMIALAAMTAGLTAMAPLADAQPMRPGMGPMDHAEHQVARNDELNDRIAHARESLNRGWGAHQLSRREYNRLSSRLNAIAAEKRRAERTGRGIDRNELASLNSQLDTLRRDTFFQKFDNNGR